MHNEMTFSEKEMLYAKQMEKGRHFIHNAIELALSFGDFQRQIDSNCTVSGILSKASERIERLIKFDVTALYLVDEQTSDLQLHQCSPQTMTSLVEDEFGFLIEQGFLAWAIRERRGINVFSRDGSRHILLHVMSTYARIRGVFVGFFPEKLKGLPDASLEILSIILRNTANAIESLACCDHLRREKKALEEKVSEKTKNLVRYERQLLQAQKMEAMVSLAGGVAHQFSNALTGLIGNLDIIEMSIQKSDEVNTYFRNVRSLIDRMAGLTKHLLTYAQGGSFKPIRVSATDFIGGLFPILRRSVKPSVQLVREQTTEPLMIEVDVVQLQMVVAAIVNNADEAITSDGSIRIATEQISLSESASESTEAPALDLDPGYYACITIKDSGQGMDQEMQRRIFDPFYSTKFEGRGLNMAAVYSIVKNHGGNIAVSSRIGHGTRVRIFLPLIETSSDEQ